jgi:hypothetical protein
VLLDIVPPPKPRNIKVIDAPTQMIVENIQSCRRKNQNLEYYTRWKNMSTEHDSWNTSDQITAHDPNGKKKIEDYHRWVDAQRTAVPAAEEGRYCDETNKSL